VSSSQDANFRQEALTHIDALFGYALTLTRDKARAEDLLQETYLRALKALAQLNPHSNVKSWLFVVMRNAWLNERRRDRSGPAFVELDPEVKNNTVDFPSNPHVVYLRKLERTQVQEAIESLPDAYREVVLLRDFEGFSYQEIATILDCPAGTVMSRLARARGKLKDMLSGRKQQKRARTV
jgi:RNA polymerase sigma-70 factor (ECF subfamily)